jgi:hypothetical protein
MTLIAQAVEVLFIGYPTMGCGAVFDERPPWHPGVLWWFFCVFFFIKEECDTIRKKLNWESYYELCNV